MLNKYSLLFGALLWVVIFSCSKDDSLNPEVEEISHTISSISPTSGTEGTEITITGTGYHTTPANNIVKFNGVAATVINASSSQLSVIAPANSGTGPVTVSIGGKVVSGPEFTYVEATETLHTIASISPDSGVEGTEVTITGTGFSTEVSNNKVKFNGIEAEILSVNITEIKTKVPAGAGEGPVSVIVNERTVIGPIFHYEEETVLSIASISPVSGPKATQVTITGTGFDSNSANVSVSFNGVAAEVKSATSTQIVVLVPSKAKDGAVSVTINGETVEGPDFEYQATYYTSTFAGSIDGTSGFVDGSAHYIRFNNPRGLTIDAEGNIYTSDYGNNRIRKINLAVQSSTFAGSGTSGAVDGTGTDASFFGPDGIVRDANGNFYVADYRNHRIRKITAAGVVTTIAGGAAGYQDGTGTEAQFRYPTGIAIDGSGNLFVVDNSNHCIRKITPSGVVTTFAGTNTQGYVDGTGTTARFTAPVGIAIDAADNLYIADKSNHCIRKITPAGVVTTFAGTNELGNMVGEATRARFMMPTGVALDSQNNLYVVDYATHSVKKITPSGKVSSAAGNIDGFTDGYGTNGKFYYPYSIAIDANGNLYVSELHRVRKVTVE